MLIVWAILLIGLASGCDRHRDHDDSPTPDCGALVGGGGAASVEFTFVPAYGSFDDLQGQVQHVIPAGYQIAAYINVDGEWWIKPYDDERTTAINCDGTFTIDITTGGIDEEATSIVAYVIPITFDPPLSYDEDVLNANSVTHAQVDRGP